MFALWPPVLFSPSFKKEKVLSSMELVYPERDYSIIGIFLLLILETTWNKRKWPKYFQDLFLYSSRSWGDRVGYDHSCQLTPGQQKLTPVTSCFVIQAQFQEAGLRLRIAEAIQDRSKKCRWLDVVWEAQADESDHYGSDCGHFL